MKAFAVVTLALMLLSLGCTTSKTTDYNSVSISEFSVLKQASGEQKVQLIFKDMKSDSEVGVSGVAHLYINDSEGFSVHESIFNISENDFSYGQRALTGARTYYWYAYFPESTIKPSVSGWGNAKIDVMLPDGRVISATTDYVSLSTY